MKSKWAMTLVPVSAIAVSVVSMTFATEAAAQAVDGGDSGAIVVTARKASERLQDVPISVTAVSSEQLRDRGAVDVKDVLRNVPGLAFSGTTRGQSNYNIRGITSSSSSATVGLYLDDISLITVTSLFSGGFDPVFFDMERLEVLKGPQGTLYGGSAMGGAIKYVSAKPVLSRVEGRASGELSTTAHGAPSYQADAVVNLPLVEDKLAVRGGLYYRHDGGYIDRLPNQPVTNSGRSSTASPLYTPLVFPSGNTVTDRNSNDANIYVARLSALWKPDDDLTILPAAYFQNYRQHDTDSFFLGGPSLTSSYRLPQSTHDKGGVYSLSIDKRLGGVKISSLTAYYTRDVDFIRDYSYLLANIIPATAALSTYNSSISKTRTFSQELRLSSDDSGASPLHWLVGLFFSRQNDQMRQVADTPGAAAILGSDLLLSSLNRTILKQYAAFGEASYKITDQFEFTAGARVFKVDQVLDRNAVGPLNGGAAPIVARRSKDDGINPKVGLSFKAARDNLIYASVAKGFRPGGSNQVTIPTDLCAADLAKLGLTAAPLTFASDKLWTYELGSKNQFAGGRVMLNAAVYFSDWKKIQQLASLSTCGYSYVDNVGSAQVKGVELEGRFKLTRSLEIGGNAAYSSAEITRGVASSPARKGDAIQGVPKWTATAYADYAAPVSNSWELQAHAEYQYRSKARRYYGGTLLVNFPGAVVASVPDFSEFQTGYQVVNGFLALKNGSTTIRLFVNNLFDVRPNLDTVLTSGVDRSTTLRPRTVGMGIARSF